MTTQILSASRAGVSSVVVHETSAGTYVIPGFVLKESAIISGAAEMDGAASAAFAGATVRAGAAQMDGQAQASFYSAIVGAAEMDGQAQALFTGVAQARGAARMDGAASMATTTTSRISARMDGAASMTAVGASNSTGHSIVGMLQNLAVHDLISINLVQTLQEAIALTSYPGTRTQYRYVFTAPIRVQSTPVPTRNAVLNMAQSVQINQTTNQKFIWGRILADIFKVSDAVGVRGLYKKSLAQLFKLADGFSITRALTLQQNINLSSSSAVASILQLLQKFLIASTSSPVLTYHFALAGRVIVKDILGHFVSVVLAQLFTVHPALSRQFVASNALAQLLTVHPALNNKLILQLNGNLQLSPSQLVHMLYKGDPLLDGVAITALYISPSGTTTTWAVNTRTNAVTEYLNYDFNSFALLDRRYIASSSDGLYELDGDTDDGALIISELMSGYLQLNEKKMFGIKGAYVAIRGGGRFYLKLIAGDGREYVYELKAQPNLMTTKVRVGKGISTTYMAFDLVTEGQDFDLDSLEFIPMTRGRRV